MKKISLLIIASAFTFSLFSQTINLQSGISLSKLSWKLGSKELSIYDETNIAYSVFAGLNYLDKKYYNLSSNIGFIRKGGKDVFDLTDENGNPIGTHESNASLDYFSFNSLIEFKYPIQEQIIPFVGLGPRIDFVVNNSPEFEDVKEIDYLNNMAIGAIIGAGVKYDLAKIQIGLRADYYLNFNKIADWEPEIGNLGGEISDKTYTISLTIGYKLNN